MSIIIRLSLLVVALIHFLPLAGALGPDHLIRLYGVGFGDPNLAILMQHRAMLFGVLGVFLAIAAFRPALQGAALLTGFISVVSFIAFALSTGGYNTEVARVVTVDGIALACLCTGMFAWLWHRRSGRR